jgi:P27 family predicted phage terminase small subunit
MRGRPEKPDWLDPIAAEAWDCIAAILEGRHVLSRADRWSLELLCVSYAAWRHAVEALAEAGPATQTAAGTFKSSPESAACDRLARLTLILLREHGLTPCSRDTVVPILQVGRDPFEEFLSGNDPIAARIKLR